jgi:hypothetical protein
MQITLKTPIYEWPQQPWDDLDRGTHATIGLDDPRYSFTPADYNVFNPDDPFPFFHL